jgi:uncharacterized protein (DUF4213/DUF364 family)
MTRTIYDLLIDRAGSSNKVRRMLLGLNWSVGEVDACGLCFSPIDPPRTLSWAGTIAGRSAKELAAWIRSAEQAEATVGTSVINAVLNTTDNPLIDQATPLMGTGPPHLAVFEHFRDQLVGAKVVVVGRYPGLDSILGHSAYLCLERRPFPDTLPEKAAPEVLPGADWTFLTASAISNQTILPLLELARGSRIVLMGPSLPWISEWADLGVHYLAGVSVQDAGELFSVAAEGGGTRIFDHAVHYRLLPLR